MLVDSDLVAACLQHIVGDAPVQFSQPLVSFYPVRAQSGTD
jgi:hypothetical protein